MEAENDLQVQACQGVQPGTCVSVLVSPGCALRNEGLLTRGIRTGYTQRDPARCKGTLVRTFPVSSPCPSPGIFVHLVHHTRGAAWGIFPNHTPKLAKHSRPCWNPGGQVAVEASQRVQGQG